MHDDQMKQAVAELGIGDLSPEEQEKVLDGFGEVALRAAAAAVLGKLAPEKQEEFAKLAEAGDAANLKAFLDAEVPGHEELVKAAVEEEVRNFKAVANSQ